MEPQPTPSTVTPVVTRLILANALVFLVLATVFTAPIFFESLQLAPSQVAARPWSLFTFLFLSGGLPQLAFSGLALALFGPPVERKLGSGVFIGYILATGFGVALLALILARFGTVAPVVGPWGVVLGFAVGYASVHADRTVPVLALPLTIRVKTLVWMMIGISVVGAIVGASTGIFHLADVGGVLAGMMFLRLRGIVPGSSTETRSTTPSVILTPIRLRVEPSTDRPAAVTGHGGHLPQEQLEASPTATVTPEEEVNRVLDKIGAEGWQSLTDEEQQFLEDISKKKRLDSGTDPA